MHKLRVVPWFLRPDGVGAILGYNVVHSDGDDVRIIETFYASGGDGGAQLAADAAEAYAGSLTCWRRTQTRSGFTEPHWKAGYVFFAEEGPDSDTAFDKITMTRHVIPNIEVVT